MSESIDERITRVLAEHAGEARFDAAGWRPAPLGRGRRVRRLRVGLPAIAATLLLVLGLGVPLVALSVLGGSDPRPRERIPATAPDDPRTWETCRDEPAGSQVIEPGAGPPGTDVEVHGAVDTSYEHPASPEERFQVWWNLDPEAWESALTEHPRAAVEGRDVVLLEKQFLMYTGPRGGSICPYQTIVRAPDAPAGTYPIVVLYGGLERGAARWSSLPAVEFTLTPGCPSGTGPWADPACPEAAWARRVIDQAGYRITGGTARSIQVEQPDDARFAPWELSVQVMSVRDADQEGMTPSSDDAYRELPEWEGAPGVRIRTTGDTYSWDRGGVRVWVMPGPGEEPFPPEAVYALVFASTEVPPPY